MPSNIWSTIHIQTPQSPGSLCIQVGIALARTINKSYYLLLILSSDWQNCWCKKKNFAKIITMEGGTKLQLVIPCCLPHHFAYFQCNSIASAMSEQANTIWNSCICLLPCPLLAFWFLYFSKCLAWRSLNGYELSQLILHYHFGWMYIHSQTVHK